MKDKFKELDTGLKVFEILKYLAKQDASYHDLERILSKISAKELSDETILKYINTLKYSGLNITKSGEVFRLENQPFMINLTEEELETLANLEAYSKSLNNERVNKEFSDFLNKISKYLSPLLKEKYIKLRETSTAKPMYDYKDREDLIRLCEKYLEDNLRLEIEENGKGKFVFEPAEIIYDKTSVYLSGYLPETASNKRINVKNIISVKQLPTRAAGNKFLNTVVFECFGRLAKNYKLKPSEKIINSSENSVIISNAQEDRDLLLRRILKYGENAKLLRPQSLRDRMKEILNEMIENCGQEAK
ncbi:WYL domain-containing protein [bacterium]|nr:WYL domain-containing protein [bacterium]